MTRLVLTFLCLIILPLTAQDAAESESSTMKDDGSRVAVLGYHDFHATRPETEMLISTAKFRKQMELLKQMDITVISMDQFIAWKQGKASIPKKCALITIDDGWKSVYTDAYPILKEFKYPFTVFLYKNYVDGGGKALTSKMIRDMVKDNVTIGSHSVSHPFPITFKKYRNRGDRDYDKFLRVEMGESKRFLESKFKTKVKSYTYPGGYMTKEMLPLVHEFGYDVAFTIEPKKTSRLTPNDQIPRYMILGNYDRIFGFATAFESDQPPATQPKGDVTGMLKTLDHPVLPEPGAMVNSRTPEISVDLSKLTDLDPESLDMHVSGFGKVPATFDPETKKFSWTVNRRLRHPTCQVLVKWANTEGSATDKPLRWTFQIDREAAYLLEDE